MRDSARFERFAHLSLPKTCGGEKPPKLAIDIEELAELDGAPEAGQLGSFLPGPR